MIVRTFSILLKKREKRRWLFEEHLVYASTTRRRKCVQGDKTETKRKKPPRSTVKLTFRVSGNNALRKFPGHPLQLVPSLIVLSLFPFYLFLPPFDTSSADPLRSAPENSSDHP